MTIVINFIAGSGSGKSLMSALVFSELKMLHYNAEYVQEYAKNLVWQNRLDELDNQYFVTISQYNMIKPLNNIVDYIVCDSGLLIGMLYNRIHKNNICNIEKTEKMIKQKMDEFNNVYIFLERNSEFPYTQEGRLQNEKEACDIDKQFKDLLDEYKLPYLSIISSKESIPKILDYILDKSN